MLEEKAQERRVDLVLEGGGVKGIGLVGAIAKLVEEQIVFPRVAGTSAGAIVGALVAAYQKSGTPLSQLKDDMLELQYERFMVRSWSERYLGVLGKAQTLVQRQGLYSTSYLREWLRAKLDAVNVHTFEDLRINDDDETGLLPQQRYRLVVHTTDLTRQALVRLPWDLPHYLFPNPAAVDITHQRDAIDRYPVVDAVVASASLPFFFQPVLQQSARGTCTWVDGGLLQNFPITVFDRISGESRWPTWGIRLSSQPPADVYDQPVRGDISEVVTMAHTVLGDWNRYFLEDEGVQRRTIYVDTMHVSATDFMLSREIQEQLFQNGYDAARHFLDRARKLYDIPW